MASERLTIEGHFGTRIPASLHRARGRELVVCLPGLRYSNDMPVMYFVRRLMEARGADVMSVDYRYDENEDFLTRPDNEQFDWIGNDAKVALSAALNTGSYRDKVLVGKSLGTIGLGWALPQLPRLADASVVWLTPSIQGTGLKARMTACRQRSLVVIGTKDPNYSPELVEDLRGAGMAVAVIDGADHGLERPGDIPASIAALAEVVSEIGTWLATTTVSR
jgi:predicted alpha/beta hydrolase